MSDLHALGRAGSDNFIGLEIIRLDEELHEVEFNSDEFTAVCPVTGQPDLYELTIRLRNTDISIESKSLKIYLSGFRNEGAFAENLVHKIRSDVLQAIGNQRTEGAFFDDDQCEVSIVQKRRGGIEIRAES